MDSTYLVLANLTAVLHGAYLLLFLYLIVVAVKGKLGNTKIGQWLFWVWIGGKISSAVFLGECVLTMLEQYLRSLSGQQSYEIGYIQHYTQKLGLDLSYTFISWLVIVPLTLAIVSELYWQKRQHRGFFSK